MKLIVVLSSLLSVVASAGPGLPGPREGWRFIACVPTASECLHSCARPHFKVVVDPKRCNPEDFRERLACYCFLNAVQPR